MHPIEQRALVLLGSLSLTVLLLWARQGAQSMASSGSSPVRDPPSAAAQKEAHVLPAVGTLLEHASSAYHARLFADEQGAVLVTQTGFVLLRGGEVAEAHNVSLGPSAARQDGALVFWRDGWLRQVSLAGAGERPVLALTRAPRYLLASQRHLAWITGEGTTSSLQTLSGDRARVVSESEDKVCAAVLRDAMVYWILQSRDGAWRIGSMGLDGQHQRLSAAHHGRPPAMLALGPDGLYFYDGPERGVRRLSFALDREDAVATQVICSPLVVSDRPICAQVGGLFDVPVGGTAPRFVAAERDGLITALAATNERVFWVAESGQDQLVVRTTLLPAPR